MTDDDLPPVSKADRLRGWLSEDVKEWTPRTAAYLFVGLDPEETQHPTQSEDWHFVWLPNYPADTFGSDAYSLARNMEQELARMLRFTESAHATRVRTPRQWVRWAEKEGISPAWLAFVQEQPDLCRALGIVPRRATPKRVATDDTLRWLAEYQAAERQRSGRPALRDVAVEACVKATGCTRPAARRAFRALPADLRLAQGAQPKAANSR